MARRRRLAGLAAAHHGLFTDHDAIASGYGRSARSYQRRAGNWLPTAALGIWRLADLPRTQQDERLEATHAWMRWLGPGWELTSWSTLEVLGLVPVSSLRPAHVVRSAAPAGPAAPAAPVAPAAPAAPADTRARRRHLDEARWSGALVVHRVHQPRVPPVRIDDLAARPVDEALCLVISHGVATGEAMPLDDAASLVDDLLARGAVERSGLVQTATALGAARGVNLLWDR